MSNKIIADVDKTVKEKLSDLAHMKRVSMKDVLVELIEKEHTQCLKKAKK